MDEMKHLHNFLFHTVCFPDCQPETDKLLPLMQKNLRMPTGGFFVPFFAVLTVFRALGMLNSRMKK
jgi:hypothetical protein